jgi:hypothetical protein
MGVALTVLIKFALTTSMTRQRPPGVKAGAHPTFDCQGRALTHPRSSADNEQN